MEERLKIVDGVLQGGGGFPVVRRGGALPLPRATARVALQKRYKKCGGAGRCRHRPLRSVTRGAMGGRPQGSPLRKHYKKCGGAGRCGEQPLRKGLCPGLKTKSPPTAVKDDALHRDTTLLRRPLTQNRLAECRYTPALSRALTFEPEAAPRPSTRRLRSHVPPSVPRPLSPARALFGGLKWGTLSFTAFYDPVKFFKSFSPCALRGEKRF